MPATASMEVSGMTVARAIHTHTLTADCCLDPFKSAAKAEVGRHMFVTVINAHKALY
jgi:hypothetical protein